MKTQSLTSEDAAKQLTRKQKHQCVSQAIHELLLIAVDGIDKGKYNKSFCPYCVIQDVLNTKQH